MKTFEQAPWIDYLDIDEKTGETILMENTPKDIRKKYEQYLIDQNNNPMK